MSEWQPIETAPKDGTAIIVAVPTKDGGWNVGEAYFMQTDNKYDKTWWWAGTSRNNYTDDPIVDWHYSLPTHWQAMPAQPDFPSVVTLEEAE